MGVLLLIERPIRLHGRVLLLRLHGLYYGHLKLLIIERGLRLPLQLRLGGVARVIGALKVVFELADAQAQAFDPRITVRGPGAGEERGEGEEISHDAHFVQPIVVKLRNRHSIYYSLMHCS
jgi:hypothetical protein